MKTKLPTKQRTHYPILTDESGNPVSFTVPFGAIHMGTGVVTIAEEDRITNPVIEKLLRAAYKRMDNHDVRMLFTWEDKAKMIRKVKKNGRWV